MKNKKQNPKSKSSGKERCFIFYDIETKSPKLISRSEELRNKIYNRCKRSKEIVRVQRSVFIGEIEKDEFIKDIRELFKLYKDEIGENSRVRIVPEGNFDDMRSIEITVKNNVPKVKAKKSFFQDLFK